MDPRLGPYWKIFTLSFLPVKIYMNKHFDMECFAYKNIQESR